MVAYNIHMTLTTRVMLWCNKCEGVTIHPHPLPTGYPTTPPPSPPYPSIGGSREVKEGNNPTKNQQIKCKTKTCKNEEELEEMGFIEMEEDA